MSRARDFLSATILAAGAVILPTVASAQVAPATAGGSPDGANAKVCTPTAETPCPDGTTLESADGQQTENGEITVTGSRIRRPNLDSAVPITSIAGDVFFQRGNTNVGDTLNDLPQLRSTFSQQNPGYLRAPRKLCVMPPAL